ncbi:MAG: ribonuclease III [Patescibacteria group bacterium]|nr:ribonuclease III [Patescibacteria group bacterium]
MPKANAYLQLKKLFKNTKLLEHALTHRSWVNEHPGNFTSNERLEFLGDAILEYITSKELFKDFPDKEEGYLTVLRAKIVNTQNLAKKAVQLEIGKYLKLSKGEEETGGRTNPSLLADTFEAIIGALYLDSGLAKVEKFVKSVLLSSINDILSTPLKDAKSRLQEYVQAQGMLSPKYEVISETGPDHDKKFTIAVNVNGKKIATGEGKSKNEAAQNAASLAIEKLSAQKD